MLYPSLVCASSVVQLCRTDAQAAVIARSLGPSVVKLSLDPNGNHVVQRALQHMPAPRNDFVLEAITASLVQVRATFRTGLRESFGNVYSVVYRICSFGVLCILVVVVSIV